MKTATKILEHYRSSGIGYTWIIKAMRHYGRVREQKRRELFEECLANLTACHTLLDQLGQSQTDVYGQANDFFTKLDRMNNKRIDEIVSSNI